MLAQIVSFPVHRGELFSDGGKSYALCNGQTLSRSAYSLLSDVWPSGAYGSTDTDIVLPDFNGTYLRGSDWGIGNDPEALSRFTPGATIPSGIVPGYFQIGSSPVHEHASGSVQTFPTGGSGPAKSTSQGNQTVGNIELFPVAARFTVVSGTDETAFEPFHAMCYPYIRVL